jgi:hypothetical protein
MVRERTLYNRSVCEVRPPVHDAITLVILNGFGRNLVGRCIGSRCRLISKMGCQGSKGAELWAKSWRSPCYFTVTVGSIELKLEVGPRG